MNAEKIRFLAQQILDDIDTPPVPDPIATPEALKAALTASKAGDVLTLSTRLVYPEPFLLHESITLRSETYADRMGSQMTVDEPAPRFVGGFQALSDAHQCLGLELRHPDPTKTIAVMGGAGNGWDRMRVLGDAAKGAKRGIDFRGGMSAITFTYVDDIFQPAQDTQAIYCQEMLPGGGLAIADSFLRAAGQSVMFGGGDPSNEAGVPSHVQLLRCVLTKRPEWITITGGRHAQQIKCALELKNVIGFTSDGCAFEYAGMSAGQGGYLFVFTPRNQGNTAPFSTVQDVTIENFTGRYASGVANFLGSDNLHPSGPLKNVLFRTGMVTDIDHLTLPGTTGRLFMFDRSPQNVTLDNIAVAGVNVAALGYFAGAAPVGFVASRLTMPPSKYGWKCEGFASGRKSMLTYMPDAQLDASVV